MKPALLILAAGMGSRYGGLKQIAGVGPNGETLTEYSLYDAIRAGFRKIVFVIRKDFEEDFKERFASKLPEDVNVKFAYQDMDAYTEGFVPDSERKKPWGTGHAVLVAKDVIDEPFAVINADDYYGQESFKMIYDFLADPERVREDQYAMVGYTLKNTLSEHGTVSRGVCETDEDSKLLDVTETTKIHRENGDVVYTDEDGNKKKLDENETVSMNLWGFHQGIFGHLQNQFREFLEDSGKELKSEFYIPSAVDRLIKEGRLQAKVLVTGDKWFGMTYREDLPVVKESITELVKNGMYPESLWNGK